MCGGGSVYDTVVGAALSVVAVSRLTVSSLCADDCVSVVGRPVASRHSANSSHTHAVSVM